MNPEYPARFAPGTMVQVIGVEYPVGSGKVSPKIGLYQEPGYPQIIGVERKHVSDRMLHEKLCGSVANGNLCLVVAVRCLPGDGKWYYLLRSVGGDTGFGWTRVSIRLKPVDG